MIPYLNVMSFAEKNVEKCHGISNQDQVIPSIIEQYPRQYPIPTERVNTIIPNGHYPLPNTIPITPFPI